MSQKKNIDFLLCYRVISINFVVFLSGERPRSRRYGRTTAMRLIVQPYGDDDDDYYYFFVLTLWCYNMQKT
jgi:hypothetical protein